MSTNLLEALKKATDNEKFFNQFSDKIANYVSDTKQ